MSSTTDACDYEQPERDPTHDTLLDQQELRARYEEQQRRLCCPSCGEDPYID